jgi:hypothetical protein
MRVIGDETTIVGGGPDLGKNAVAYTGHNFGGFTIIDNPHPVLIPIKFSTELEAGKVIYPLLLEQEILGSHRLYLLNWLTNKRKSYSYILVCLDC